MNRQLIRIEMTAEFRRAAIEHGFGDTPEVLLPVLRIEWERRSVGEKAESRPCFHRSKVRTSVSVIQETVWLCGQLRQWVLTLDEIRIASG